MNNDSRVDQLREKLWRRPLTEAEEAELQEWLEHHPEAAAEIEEEAELSRAVAGIGNAPVPTNFTARVMREIERTLHHDVDEHGRPSGWWWRVFLPRTALATGVLALGIFTYWNHERHQAEQLARKVHVIATAAVVPPTDALADFDAVANLDASTEADLQLLALLE